DELRAKPGATDASPEYPEGFWATKAREAQDAGHPLPDHLRVHKPYIDHWTYDSPFAEGEGGARPRMRRVPEVIDCWWDAGSMPFAQWGYPHAPDSEKAFAERFPADFISEAIDQTRGWFYGLLAINTLLFTGDQAPVRRDYPLPYRTCIVLGHMMGEDGLKMSKRTKNYKEPSYVFDTLGADAMRWYFFSAQTPWTSVRFQEAAIRDAQREMLVRLYNVFSFFNIYANIDGFTVHRAGEAAAAGSQAAVTGRRAPAQRSEIDRWILSELHITIREVRAALDRFENYPAAQKLIAFVDALSNWYVRRCRDRFWRSIEGGDSERDQDKWDAYNTLYECLTTLSRLIAPFTPFFAETMYQNLEAVEPPGRQEAEQHSRADSGEACLPNPLSVHMCDYPAPDESLIDETLAEEMDLVRDIASLGLAARAQAKLRVRQPLARVEIILARPEHEQWLSRHASLIAEELNVKEVEFTAHADHYVE
ncbi:MAG: isoleucine--tRNA ligase, partial [Planctomycetota bacterium]